MTAALEPALDRPPIGWRILYFESLDSTNTYALSLAGDLANHGVVILAGAQTAGRGQHGRSWQATPGSSVLMSVLVFPPPELRRPALLTAWAAVSVCDLIEQIVGTQASIKWPNDVLVNGRKVCGILIEQRSFGPHVATVVGIGLNVKQDARSFEAAGLPGAGALAMFADYVPDCPEVARLMVPCLNASYECLKLGERTAIENRWRQRLGFVGAQVTVEGTRVICHGQIVDIGFDELNLKLSGGEPLRIPPEEIRHIHLE